MGIGLREQPFAYASRARLLDRDDGVSPVVGMILVLGVSIVGIAAILYWGLPAIDEMKANVEFRSAQTQFEELDATVKELVAGTTEKTAKRWQPTLNRGQVGVYNNTEKWLFTVDTYVTGITDNNIVWLNLSDGDSNFTLHSLNTSDDVKVEAYIVHGTSSATPLNVTAADADMPSTTFTDFPQQSVQTDVVTMGSRMFRVSQDGVDRRIENATFKFVVYSGSDVIAQAWYAATGRIDFNLEAGLGSKAVVANNGAVLTGVNGGYAIVNSPPLPPPSVTSGISRTFARLVLMGGNASFAGTDTFDMLISLYATATLASYDCAATDHTDCVRGVKFFNYGTYQQPWYQHLQNRNRGYGFQEISYDNSFETTKYLEDRRDYQGFTLLASSLKLVNS